jgi:glutamine---fructose-6-phosphate transaminase (isomerizing)
MCGIFGVVVSGRGLPLQATVSDLFLLSESRGKEASGLAMATGESIRVLKTAAPGSQLCRTRAYRDFFKPTNGAPIAIIGHSRLVTNGAAVELGNNQPVIAGEMVGVHNGIIVNVDQLAAKYGITRKHEVDTEVLLRLIRHFHKELGSLVKAVQAAFAELEGVANVAVVLEDYDQLLLATNNGSLYVALEDGSAIFASEEFILSSVLRKRGSSAQIEHLAAGRGMLIDLSGARSHRFPLAGSTDCPEKNGVRRRVHEIELPAVRVAPAAPQTSRRPERAPSWMLDEYERNAAAIAKVQRCSRCVLPATVPFVDIDSSGVCKYCRHPEPLVYQGRAALDEVLKTHRRSDGKPDCLIPLSGGRDSCHCLHLFKTELGMNPIAYTYDWGMVTDLARRNASRMCAKLGIEHIIISADITAKRNNIRKNVEAWMKQPDLGTIPLFMAGDKQFFYYADQLRKRTGIELLVFAMNPLERTDFKHGFCGIGGGGHSGQFWRLDWMRNLQIIQYYGKHFLTNPAYLNASLFDTAFAYFAYYVMPHNYLFPHDYVEWDERRVEEVLLGQYDWETSPDTKSTWRIGDGTASFYNYIYYTVAGFTENDTFRSNQIREGKMTRDEALVRVVEENRPRYESLRWYADTINIDLERCLRVIHDIPKIYARPQ